MAKTKSYHHGNLKQALLKEAERILEKEGIQALSLRAAARAAGVSHAAPTNHFGDLTGLLDELAAEGFVRLMSYLKVEGPPTERELSERLTKIGLGYIRFAAEHTGLFMLMYRSERLDASHPRLNEVVVEARKAFREAITPAGNKLSPEAKILRQTAFWSLIHGYAMLMAEGRLGGMLASLSREDEGSLFKKVLGSVRLS